MHIYGIKAAPVEDGVGGDHRSVALQVLVEPLVWVNESDAALLDEGVDVLAFPRVQFLD
jgi:hypothetical protein